MEVYKSHNRFLSEPVTLLDRNIPFIPQDLNLSSFDTYPKSGLNSKLLSREVYVHRDKYKEKIRQFKVVCHALQIYSSSVDLTIHNKNNKCKSYYLPSLFGIGGKIKVPKGTNFIYKDERSIYLFPGKIVKNKEGELSWITFNLEKIFNFLDNKSNYDVGVSILNIENDETLETLESKFISYLRNKIKREGSNKNNIFRLKEDNTRLPLEEIISNIQKGDKVSEQEKEIYWQFPLTFNEGMRTKIRMYLPKEEIAFTKAKDYIKDEREDKHLLICPSLASPTPTERFNLAIDVELRALLLNYAYYIENDEYEDFLGDIKWIISPISITESNDMLYGVTEYPLYFFSDLLEKK